MLSEYHNTQLIEYTGNCNSLQLQVLAAVRAMGARTVLATWPKCKETSLPDIPFIHALRTRLGIGLPEFFKLNHGNNTTCKACNWEDHPAVPEHFTSCPTTHQSTHRAVINEVFKCTQAAGITEAIIERPLDDNLAIDIWIRDPCPKDVQHPYYMIDPTIRQAFSANQTTLPNTARILQTANTAKYQTYASQALALSATVVPLAFTSFGAYHFEFKKFLTNMTRIAIATGNHFPSVDGSFTNKWRTNILFTIARATARSASEAALKHNINYAMEQQALHVNAGHPFSLV